MASIIPAHNGPTKESGESVCPKQTQWKTAWQRFLAGNKTKRTRVPIQPEFLQLIGAGEEQLEAPAPIFRGTIWEFSGGQSQSIEITEAAQGHAERGFAYFQ